MTDFSLSIRYLCEMCPIHPVILSTSAMRCGAVPVGPVYIAHQHTPLGDSDLFPSVEIG